MKLLLFDIDLTLLRMRPRPDGLNGMYTSLMTHYGVKLEHLKKVTMAGNTDPLIVKSLFQLNEVPYQEDRDYETFMQIYLPMLEEGCRAGDRELLPGAAELVKATTEHPSFKLALLTGNDERGARIKLQPFHLNPFFPVGAFGSDHAHRPNLVPIAIQRAIQHYGHPFRSMDAIIIGDSPADVQTANAHQLSCLAVTTGYADEKTLREAGPCTIVDSLQDTQAILKLLVAM